MKSRYGCFTLIGLAAIVILMVSIGGTDINSESDVVKRMQGSWTGYDHDGYGGMYTHWKLVIKGSSFKGWMQPAHTDDTPAFSSTPDAEGTFTLSPVQGYTNSSGKYRNINFTMKGGGFGNNSLEARSLTNNIVYDDSNGLYVVGWGAMSSEGGGGTWQGWLITIGILVAIFFEVKARLFGEGHQTSTTENEVENATAEPQAPINQNQVGNTGSQSVSDLHKAKELLDSGAINVEEFTRLKSQILGANVSKTQEEKVYPVKAKERAPIHYTPEVRTKQKKSWKNVSILSGVLVVLLLAIYTYSTTQEEKLDTSGSMNFVDETSDSPVEVPQQSTTEEADNSPPVTEVESMTVDNDSDGFLRTPTGQRYRKVIVQVPNHDEENTATEMELTGPVEGFYFMKDGDNTRSIRISYEGTNIYVLHWQNNEDAVREDAYITSKGYFAFGSEEFDFDRFGESVNSVDELTLVDRFSGVEYKWNTEWQGD